MRRRATIRRLCVLAAGIMPLGTGSVLAQCAMCGRAAGAGEVGRALSISVLFLLGVLSCVVAGLVALVVRSRNREADGAPAGDRAVSAAAPDRPGGRWPAGGAVTAPPSPDPR